MLRFTFVVILFYCSAEAWAATCCNTPTIWTFKNLDASPVVLTCALEKSAAWKGEKIEITTEQIEAKGSYKHTWNRGWYADGMGMIPGQWSCAPKTGDAKSKPTALIFSTDWGENVTITWNKSRGSVARK